MFCEDFFQSEHDIALRGTGGQKRLGDPKNGPFLGLVEMMVLYDSVLASHLSRVQTKQIYELSIQDKFIDLLGNKILCPYLSKLRVIVFILSYLTAHQI